MKIYIFPRDLYIHLIFLKTKCYIGFFSLKQAALEKECPDIMKLGLLHVIGVRKATARKQPTFLAFEHESLQQFAASKFVMKRLETAENVKVNN